MPADQELEQNGEEGRIYLPEREGFLVGVMTVESGLQLNFAVDSVEDGKAMAHRVTEVQKHRGFQTKDLVEFRDIHFGQLHWLTPAGAMRILEVGLTLAQKLDLDAMSDVRERMDASRSILVPRGTRLPRPS